MVSDSIITHISSSPSPKYLPKKKRVNRSAKLKQCKLDARREQWLSQVKSNKDSKEELNDGEFNGPPIEIPKKVSVDEIHHHRHHHHDSDSELSPANSPLSSVSGGNESGNTYTASSSSSSSFSSGGSYSGSITEEEEGGVGRGGDECLDDWEAVADALAAASDENPSKTPNSGSSQKRENGFVAGGITTQISSNDNVYDAQARKSKSENVSNLCKGGVNSRAWRPDDAFRPQTLPNLAKQRSFPANPDRLSCNSMNPWVHSNGPTSCPICCEDLDLTDSSFLPCTCGFRLCLFCHNRILEDDGRCPGCRKPYACGTSLEKETRLKLTRSCSMFSRV